MDDLWGRNRATYDEIVKTWSQLYDNDFKVAEGSHPMAAKLADEQALSIYAKLLITWVLSRKSKKEFAKGTGQSESSLRAILEAGRPRPSAHQVDRFIDAANALNKTSRTISVQAFTLKEFAGAHAPRDFAYWLRDIEAPPSQGLGLWKQRDPLPYLPTDKRGESLKSVRNFLTAADGPQLQVIYARDMSRGLTAFADALITELDGTKDTLEGRPILYLPVSSYVPPYQKIDLPLIVGWLDAFYAGGPLPGAKSPGSSEDLTEAFDRIRRGMAKWPATIILNGYPDYGGVLGDLRALIADDPTTEVLKHIIHPSTADSERPFNVGTFRKTRIILLADGPVDWLAPYAAPPLELPPPSDDGQKGLVDKANYDNPDEVRTYLTGRMIAQDETILLLVDACISAQSFIVGDAATTIPRQERAKGLAEELIETLRAIPNNAFILIAFLALSLDGIRVGTLMRVLRRYADMQGLLLPFPKRPVVADRDIALQSICALAERLSSVIMGVDPILERAAVGRAGFEMSDRAGGGQGADQDAFRILRLSRPEIRTKITEALVESVEPEVLALMHRLLADDAILRYTFSARHSDRTDAFDKRMHRSLIRALYHGFNSLMAPEAVLAAAAGDGPEILPSSRAETYRRLYGNFYRHLLEAPPNWEVSRSMGAAAVKRDLLLVAMNAPIEKARRYPTIDFESRLEVNLPLWLLDGECKGAADLIEDMACAYARAAFQLDDFEGLRSLETAIDRAASQLPNLAAAFPLLKVRIDTLILEMDFEDAQELVERHLASVGVKWSGLSEEIEKVTQSVQAAPDEAEASRAIESGANKVSESLLENVEDATSPSVLARLSDVISRHAEIQSMKAHRADDSRGFTGRFLHAFITFLIAERCRRQAFDTAPLGRSHLISGHQTWAFVRTALLILKYGEARPGAMLPSRAYLLAKARRQSDILARYYVRYAAERSSLLLMEAAIARVGAKDLAEAQYLLREADRRMIWAADRPIVRMRLLYQRCAFLMQQADIVDRADAAIYLDAAEFDQRRLAVLADRSGARLWKRFAEDRHRELSEARAKLCQA